MKYTLYLVLILVTATSLIFSCSSKKIDDLKSNSENMGRKFATDKFLYEDVNKKLEEEITFVYDGSEYRFLTNTKDWMGSPGKYMNYPTLEKDKLEILSGLAKEQLTYHYMKLMMNAAFKVDLLSHDNRYLYLPARASFVLDLKTREVIQFFRPRGDHVGNLFYDNIHMAIFEKSVTVTNLQLGISSTVILHDGEDIHWAELTADDQIIYTTIDAPTKIKKLNYRSFDQKDNSKESDKLQSAVGPSIFNALQNQANTRNETHTVDGVEYEVRIDGFDEPNNGRMVTVGEFLIDGKKFEGKGYSGFFDFEIGRVSFFSPDRRFIYAPYENGPVIYDTKTKSYFSLIVYGDWHANLFQDNFILTKCAPELVIINPVSRISEHISSYGKCSVKLTDKNSLLLTNELNKELTILEPMVLN